MSTLAELQSQRIRVVGFSADAYLLLAGVVMWLWLRRSGVETTPLVSIICLLPVALGLVFALTSTEDPRQYLARVLACAAFVPVLLLFWGTSQSPAVADPGRAVWPFAVGAALGHALVFVGGIFAGGSLTTTVPAAPGAAMVSSEELMARVLSLQGSVLGVASTGSRQLHVRLLREAAENRSHEVELQLDEGQRTVRVRETLSARGARPRTASEASLRGPGDPGFDPARPQAGGVSSITLQTTLIVPSRLAHVPLRLQSNRVEVADDFLKSLDGEGMVTLLCAVVTESGWRWQPAFLGGRNDD